MRVVVEKGVMNTLFLIAQKYGILIFFNCFFGINNSYDFKLKTPFLLIHLQ